LSKALTNYRNNEDRAEFIQTIREIKNAPGNEDIKELYEGGRGVGYYIAKVIKSDGIWGDENKYTADRMEVITKEIISKKKDPTMQQTSQFFKTQEEPVVQEHVVDRNMKYNFGGNHQSSLWDIATGAVHPKHYTEILQEIIKAKADSILANLGNEKIHYLVRLVYSKMADNDRYDFYLQIEDDNSPYLKIMEENLLTQFTTNQLQEPEVISKMLKRVANGYIPIENIDKSLSFFVQQHIITPFELMKILQNNFKYFIKKDGEEGIRKILTETQFITPLKLKEFESITSKRVLEKLQDVDDDKEKSVPLLLKQESIRDLVEILQNGTLLNLIDQQVKHLIKNMFSKKLSRHIDDELAGTILSIIKNVNKNKFNNQNTTIIMIKQHLSNKIFPENNNIDVDDLKLMEELAKELLLVDIEKIKTDYIKQHVTQYLPFKEQKSVIAIIHQYLNWPQIIEEAKKEYYVELQHTILNTANQLSPYPTIQSAFIMNCLPFISYSRIKKLALQNKAYTNKFEIIFQYCHHLQLEDNNDEPLSIMMVTSLGQQEPVILQADNCLLFNPLNIEQGVGLKGFKIVHSCNESTLISEEITPTKLQNMVLYPDLKNAFLSQFSYKNVIHKTFSAALKEYIQNDKDAKLSIEQMETMENICYEIATRPLDRVPLTVTCKKKFIGDLGDDRQLISEYEDHHKKMTIPAGEFITIRNSIESIKKNNNNKEHFLAQLPSIVHQQTKNSFFMCCLEKEVKILLTQHKELSEAELYYIIGVWFMSLSSVNGFGYHEGTENVSVAHFRLFGGYCLAKASCLFSEELKIKKESLYKLETITEINKQIEASLLSEDCAGMITNKLYGLYCEPTLKPLVKNIDNVLNKLIN
jgi:hypothetical protein